MLSAHVTTLCHAHTCGAVASQRSSEKPQWKPISVCQLPVEHRPQRPAAIQPPTKQAGRRGHPRATAARRTAENQPLTADLLSTNPGPPEVVTKRRATVSSISSVVRPPFYSMRPLLALNDLALQEGVPGGVRDSQCWKVSTIGARERQSCSRVEFLVGSVLRPRSARC